MVRKPSTSEVTLITGASSGIGYNLARRLAALGDAVVVVARRRAQLEALAAEIKNTGGRALAVAADVTDRAALDAAVALAASEFGSVTRLVANAGGGRPTHVAAYDAADIEDIIRLNLIGVINSVGAVLPAMLERGTGQLVATGSLAGRRGLPTGAAYSAAKAGVANFMQSLAIDLSDTGIDVTLLEPGFVAAAGKPQRWPRMPMEVVTEHMTRAIVARRGRWRGPPSLVAAASALGLLPWPVYNHVLAGRGRSPKT